MKTLYLDNRAFSVSLGLLAFGFLFLVWFSYQRAETLAFRDTAEHVVGIANLQVDLVRASHNAGMDPRDDTSMAVWIQRLQTIFAAYARTNPNIAQIRYIGLAEHGREVVRVDRSAEGVKLSSRHGRLIVLCRQCILSSLPTPVKARRLLCCFRIPPNAVGHIYNRTHRNEGG